jgi:hypothetical protein
VVIQLKTSQEQEISVIKSIFFNYVFILISNLQVALFNELEQLQKKNNLKNIQNPTNFPSLLANTVLLFTLKNCNKKARIQFYMVLTLIYNNLDHLVQRLKTTLSNGPSSVTAPRSQQSVNRQ